MMQGYPSAEALGIHSLAELGVCHWYCSFIIPCKEKSLGTEFRQLHQSICCKSPASPAHAALTHLTVAPCLTDLWLRCLGDLPHSPPPMSGSTHTKKLGLHTAPPVRYGCSTQGQGNGTSSFPGMKVGQGTGDSQLPTQFPPELECENDPKRYWQLG